MVIKALGAQRSAGENPLNSSTPESYTPESLHTEGLRGKRKKKVSQSMIFQTDLIKIFQFSPKMGAFSTSAIRKKGFNQWAL